jgi:hypothetical protein
MLKSFRRHFVFSYGESLMKYTKWRLNDFNVQALYRGVPLRRVSWKHT